MIILLIFSFLKTLLTEFERKILKCHIISIGVVMFTVFFIVKTKTNSKLSLNYSSLLVPNKDIKHLVNIQFHLRKGG